MARESGAAQVIKDFGTKLTKVRMVIIIESCCGYYILSEVKQLLGIFGLLLTDGLLWYIHLQWFQLKLDSSTLSQCSPGFLFALFFGPKNIHLAH